MGRWSPRKPRIAHVALITDEHERADWQARLVAGHAVRSQILGSLEGQVRSTRLESGQQRGDPEPG